jgi:RNA polymerase sigma factor (sigma-70 family)
MARNDPFVDAAPLIRRVYSYVAYRIGDGPEAEDLTSETFERALRYRSSYDPKRGAPLPWLIGIARRCIASRPFAPLSDATAEELASPGDLEQSAVDRLTIVAAVATLPERDRELVALRYGADLSARQIGEVLGMTPNAVDVALHRALGRVREEVEDINPRPDAGRVPNAASGT